MSGSAEYDAHEKRREADLLIEVGHPSRPDREELMAQHVEQIRTRARAEALRDAADAWTQGAWADTPRHAERAQDRIAAANYFGQWLRARAEAVEAPRRPA